MSAERTSRDEVEEENTPPTRSYVDALLKGNISHDELANVRAEIADGRIVDDEDEGQQTRFHTYSLEERLDAIPDELEDEGQQTRFHTYTLEERLEAIPEPHEAPERTPAHAFAPPARGSVLPDADEEEGVPTRFHAYAPGTLLTARPGPGDDDDDARTLFRPSTRPVAPSSRPVAPSSRPLAPSTRPLAPSSRPVPPSTYPASPSSRPLAGSTSYAIPPSRPMPSSYPAPSSQPVPLSARLIPSAPPAPPSQPIPLSARLIPSAPPAPPSSPGHVPSDRTPRSWPAAPASEPPLVDLDLSFNTPAPTAVFAQQSGERALSDATYLDALGGPTAVPRLAVAPAQLTSLPLGYQAGSLVARIDGESSVDDLIDISGLSRLDTLRILHDLVQQGVVTVGKR